MKYKIAVASSDGVMVDTHFGHTDTFAVYEVDEETGEFFDAGDLIAGAACGGGQCGGNSHNHEGMNAIAESFTGIDYVLVARIGPHAIQALARKGVTAYDICLPIDEAILKINTFRKKIKARDKRMRVLKSQEGGIENGKNS